MCWDPSRGMIVLHGGFDGAADLGDTWAWDGLDWSPIQTATRPAPRSSGMPKRPGLAFDPVQGMLLASYEQPWMLRSRATPSSNRSGVGCSGSSGPPTLDSTEPLLGNTAFQLELGNAPAGTACVVALSAASMSQPLGGGCTLYLADFDVQLAEVTNAFGHANVPLPIPFDNALRSQTFYAQGAVLDPGGPLGGIALTAMQVVRIGD